MELFDRAVDGGDGSAERAADGACDGSADGAGDGLADIDTVKHEMMDFVGDFERNGRKCHATRLRHL